GKVLADTVDLDNICAGVNERLMEGDSVGKRDVWVERELHHGGGAAGDEEEGESFIGRGVRNLVKGTERGGCSGERFCVGERMAAGEEFNPWRQICRSPWRDEHTREIAGRQ